MRSKVVVLVVAALAVAIFSPPVYAQKGMGDDVGVARQAVKPEIVKLSGTVLSVETKICEKTTGRGLLGTHVSIKTEKGDTLIVDLGWADADAVKSVAEKLTVGKSVNIVAFQTEKMPKDRYVAKSLTIDGKTTDLRDEDLRPVWAGAGGRMQQPAGRGLGRGLGRGWRRNW